jgi:hypothetical protein
MLVARLVLFLHYEENISWYFSQCSASMNCSALGRVYEHSWNSDGLAIDTGSKMKATELVQMAVTRSRTSVNL